MASKIFGTVKAPIKQADGKTKYVTVGRAIRDENGRIALYIETLPRDMANWTGWLNIYDDEPTQQISKPQRKGAAYYDNYPDDQPF